MSRRCDRSGCGREARYPLPTGLGAARRWLCVGCAIEEARSVREHEAARRQTFGREVTTR